jgi:enoyl-CoA hydratase/carnithine racemase
MSNHVLTTTQESILQIQLNRPERKNALTLAMYTAIAEAITQAEADDTIRVTLITGTGDAFTSGNDITDFIQAPPLGPPQRGGRGGSPVFYFMRAITQAQKPLVAAVNGLAIGIGTTMLLHCDLVYAAASARFRLPFVNLALVPELGSSLLLPRMLGHQRAAELLMLGDFFDAQKAYAFGLVNAVYEDKALLDMAWQKAQQLAAQPPAALRLTKSLLKRGNSAAVEETMAEELKHFQTQLQSPEAMEALQAFMERRKPDFSKFK